MTQLQQRRAVPPRAAGGEDSPKWRGILRALTLTALTVAALCPLDPAPADAAKALRVPEEYFTIQEAMDAASAGDRVVLSNGSYRQQVRLRSGVTLEGAGGRDSCRIIPPAGTNHLVFGDSLQSPVVIRGITFDGKKLARQGIRVLNSEINIVDCRVRDFNSGIWLVGCPRGRIEGNDIHDCTVQGLCLENSSAEIFGNTFRFVTNYAIASLGTSRPLVGGSRAHANHFRSSKSSIDFGNGSPYPIDARYNDWGPATTVELNAKGYPANISVIEDRFDGPGSGPVDYRHWEGEPFLQSLRSEPLRLAALAGLVVAVLVVIAGVIARASRRRSRIAA